MYGNMRLDYTDEKKHQYWGRLDLHILITKGTGLISSFYLRV